MVRILSTEVGVAVSTRQLEVDISRFLDRVGGRKGNIIIVEICITQITFSRLPVELSEMFMYASLEISLKPSKRTPRYCVAGEDDSG